ncbi:MAG: LysM domain-containing protein [Sterolibacterium sp.]
MNGAAIAVSETFRTSKNRSFVVDNAGRILQKTENGGTQHYFYANDKPVGSSGALAAADFDYNTTPVTDQYPALTPGNYVVSAGDTLRGIALAVYGDAQLWYLIADANGLQTDAELTVGGNLTIPNKVTNLRNAYDTYKPYEPGRIIGDLTPTLPNPPPPKKDGGGCGGLGRIIMLAVQIVVSYLIPGPIGAMLGNLAGQVVGNVLGVQDGISWKEVAKAGLSSFIGGQLGAEGSPLAGSDFPMVVARAAVSNVLTQGISVAVGLQEKFDWKGVAAAAVGAGVSHVVGNAIGESQYGEERWAEIHDKPNIFGKDFGNTFSRELATGFASGIAKQVVYGGKANWANIIADAFGNALGNSIAYSATAAASTSQQASALDSAEAEAWSGGGLKLKPGQADTWGPQFASENDYPAYTSPSYSLADGDTSVRFPTQIGDRFSHTIQAGENLTGIAASYGLSLGELLAMNELANPNLIYAGQDLTVPVKGLVSADVSGAIEKAFWRWNASTVSQVAASATAGASVGGMCTPENPSGLSQTDVMKQMLDPLNTLRSLPDATISAFEAGTLSIPRQTTWADDFADGVKGGIDYWSNRLKGVAQSDPGWLGTTAKVLYPLTGFSRTVFGFVPEAARFFSHPLQSFGDALDFGKTVYQHPELIDKWAGDWGRKSWYEQVADVAALGSGAYLGGKVGNLVGSASWQAVSTGSRWAWQAGASTWSRLAAYDVTLVSVPSAFGQTGGIGLRVESRSTSFFDELATRATRNPDSARVVLGRFDEGGKSYVDVAAHYEASYFKLENYRELSGSMTSYELWQVNKSFLDQQIKAGKEIILSHDPARARGSFAREVQRLEDLGYHFVPDAWVWRALR